MMTRLALAVSILGMLKRDLDVGVPPGNPLDFVRMPTETPPGVRKDTPTETPKPGPGRTQVEERMPRQFPVLSRPLTVDFAGHLRWQPERNPDGTPTGEWKLGPKVPETLYMHCAAFFLMSMLHPAQVSERESISYLIEIGEPAAYAASATRGEQGLAKMAKSVTDAVGGLAWVTPASRDPLEKQMGEELTKRHPYDDKFGAELFKLPDRAAVTILIKFCEQSNLKFLRRNAVFALRVFDDPAAVPVFRKLVKSGDKVVRNRALAGLIRWRDPEIVPWLIEQLDDSDKPFASYALYALGWIGDTRATMPIVSAIKSNKNDWEFLWAALPALALLQDSRKEVKDLLWALQAHVRDINDPQVNMLGQQMDPEGTRKRILEERLRIAKAFIGDPEERLWLKGAGLMHVNKRLQEVFEERTKPPPPPPADPPKPKPEEIAARVLADWRPVLLQYSGVKSAEVADRGIRVVVATEADADDLRIILGGHIAGVDLNVEVAPSR